MAAASYNERLFLVSSVNEIGQLTEDNFREERHCKAAEYIFTQLNPLLIPQRRLYRDFIFGIGDIDNFFSLKGNRKHDELKAGRYVIKKTYDRECGERLLSLWINDINISFSRSEINKKGSSLLRLVYNEEDRLNGIFRINLTLKHRRFLSFTYQTMDEEYDCLWTIADKEDAERKKNESISMRAAQAAQAPLETRIEKELPISAQDSIEKN
ncbi:MAG TPA: hypothetical protein VJI75_03830 [Candidatus Nanoarchaeia archaeon]|nr:hypothetical protein [Candidatus Nanoarchaeia archaeon]